MLMTTYCNFLSVRPIPSVIMIMMIYAKYYSRLKNRKSTSHISRFAVCVAYDSSIKSPINAQPWWTAVVSMWWCTHKTGLWSLHIHECIHQNTHTHTCSINNIHSFSVSKLNHIIAGFRDVLRIYVLLTLSLCLYIFCI